METNGLFKNCEILSNEDLARVKGGEGEDTRDCVVVVINGEEVYIYVD